MIEAICDRFVDLDEDEDGNGLCYSWPLYLTGQPSGSEFWETLHEDIICALRSKKVLQSQDRQAPRDLKSPEDVRYVPKNYRFEDGTLFDLPSINKTHLSFAYDHVHEVLVRSLGVSQLTIGDLCEEFCKWVGQFGIAGLKEKPDEWHSRVAATFCRKGGRIKQELKRIPIVPLRDGSWVHATEAHLYLPSPNKNEHVPSGINISIVAEDAALDSSRRKFYEYLDIKEYNPGEVCKLIHELHRELASSSNKKRLVKGLIDDAVYLFKYRSKLESSVLPDIRFAVRLNRKIIGKRSPRIYILDPKSEDSIIAKYTEIPGNPFAVLIKDYDDALDENDATAFREWLLRSNATFSTIPNLVRKSKLTSEWEFLREQNVLDLLYTVRTHCSATTLPPAKLVEAVPELEVRCLDGEHRALGGLAVPTLDLMRHCPHLDFADLPNPTLQEWKFLERFRVITERSTTAVLKELQALKRISVQDINATFIRDLYEALNSDTLASEKQIV